MISLMTGPWCLAILRQVNDIGRRYMYSADGPARKTSTGTSKISTRSQTERTVGNRERQLRTVAVVPRRRVGRGGLSPLIRLGVAVCLSRDRACFAASGTISSNAYATL